jgi:hypothetical protein
MLARRANLPILITFWSREEGSKRTEKDLQGSKCLGFFSKLLVLLGRNRHLTPLSGGGSEVEGILYAWCTQIEGL